MKTSNKSSTITGIFILALAAFFSICLILQPLNFGVDGPGRNNFFYLIGNILATVYGFSSILIPVFLLVSGLSCFATTWTAKKTLRLLTALIPFITCVITENIIRSIVSMHTTFTGIKISVAIITGLMLIIIEYLGVGIIAEKISRNKKTVEQNENESVPVSESTEKPTIESVPESFEPKAIKPKAKFHLPKKNKSEDDSSIYEDITETITEKSNNPEKPEISVVNIENKTEPSIFDEALLKLETKSENETASSAGSYGTMDASSIPSDVIEVSNESSTEEKSEKIEVKEEAQNEQTITAQENSTTKDSEDDDEELSNKNPSSMITQEEFAALTTPTFDEQFENSPHEKTEDELSLESELEWPNLPPKPATLPADYDEDYVDENDPDLEFPPKEEIFESPIAETDATGIEEPEFDESESEETETNEDYEQTEMTDENFPDFSHFETDITEDFDDNSQENVEESQDSTEESFEIDDDFEPQEETENQENSDIQESQKAPIYSDEIHENPSFSHGITIHSADEQSEEKKASKPVTKSNFPSRIQLNQDVSEEITSNNFSNDVDSIENNNESNENDDSDYHADEQQEIEFTEPKFETQEKSHPEPQPTIFPSAGSSVFSAMEQDIRRQQADRQQSERTQTVSSLDNLPPAANNLTANELTDFFNAQQEENTPKTKVIAPNPPKVGNRATKKGPYVIPSDLLTAYKDDQYWIIDEATKQAALNLKQTLAEFNIEAEIIGIKKGPVVTMFEILPAPGVKLSKIVALQDNIALSLAAQSVRIVAPIPGKQAVGIEVPNKHRSVVGFREIIEMDLPDWNKMAVPVILGKDILGKAQLIDLAKTPHMLIAGATGSGKSVCVNSLILSILYKRSFRDVKMILVDPKVVELKLYNNIPHLLTPVITEPKKAIQALQWCLCEMERRYALLDSMGVRDISNYNAKIKQQDICTEKLPYIVVIIDEFADLMATSGKELETIVARLTAMSRAVGIHLVLATQRPSVNVITGLIKANIPTRIAFMVASRTDSNIIIDTVGAEKLLGRGDMLYASATDPAPIRIQGTFVNDNEVEDVVNAVKEYGEPDYIDDEMFVEDDEESARDLFGEPMDDDDPLYDQALQIVVEEGKASASYLQRRLKIGYNRAARLVEEMEDRGIVGPANGSKPREVIHVPY